MKNLILECEEHFKSFDSAQLNIIALFIVICYISILWIVRKNDSSLVIFFIMTIICIYIAYLPPKEVPKILQIGTWLIATQLIIFIRFMGIAIINHEEMYD